MKHIKFIQITENKKRFLPLLLMADEQENMIDRYLDRGTLYAILDDAYKSSDTNQQNLINLPNITQSSLKGVCVLTNEGNGILEIKNLAIVPTARRQGYGKAAIEQIVKTYRKHYDILQVGTGESPLTVPFYQACGFTFSHRIEGFFTKYYDHPICENGVILKDMVYFRKSLKTLP